VIEYCRRTEPNDARQCRLTFFGERLLLRSSTGRNGSNCDVDVRVRPTADVVPRPPKQALKVLKRGQTPHVDVKNGRVESFGFQSRRRDAMMGRRRFIGAVAGSIFLAPIVATTQIMKRVRRIGVLSPGPTLSPAEYQGVWAPLRELGWIEGQNVVFERRWAEGRPERLLPLAQELVRLNVEIITTIGAESTIAAQSATTSIPIVMLSTGDPVASGLVAGLSHPGGNVTGISMVAPELDAKRVTLLRELVPGLQRVGVLVNPPTAIAGFSRAETEKAIRSLGMQPLVMEVSSFDGVDEAIAEVVGRQGQALVVHDDVLFSRNQLAVMSAVLSHRLPAAVEGRGMLEAGGLISYENDRADQVRRFAIFVDKVLRGAKPADLPIEQPTRFKLMINLRTARTLGITVPETLLVLADEVIQ
jgi:putative tryptophan/tyrosine transport system substrate-binding protein